MFSKKPPLEKKVYGFTPASYEILGPDQFAEIIKRHRGNAPPPEPPPEIIYPPPPKVRARPLPTVGHMLRLDDTKEPDRVEAVNAAKTTKELEAELAKAERKEPEPPPVQPPSKQMVSMRIKPETDAATIDLVTEPKAPESPLLTLPEKPVELPVESPKEAPKEAPMPEPMPRKDRTSLLEYCMTLGINHHTETVSTLVEHMNGLNDDSQYKPNILLVTGPSGCGKTFCVRRAVKDAGFDLIDVDSLDIDITPKKTDKEKKERFDTGDRARSAIVCRPDSFGPNASKRICVVLFDAVDGLEAKRRSKITKVIQSLMVDDKKSKAKKRAEITLRPNLVILTADDWYNPNLRDMVNKLQLQPKPKPKPTEKSKVPEVKTNEVKVNELNHSQMTSLVEECCAYLGVPMTPRIYRLISANTDSLSALLTKVEFCAPMEDGQELSMNVDERTFDIFKCCRTIFQPPEVRNPKTNQQEPMGFDRYSEIWELGGEKVENILFNSYPDFVRYIPETPEAVKTYIEAKIEQQTDDLKELERAAKDSMKDMIGSGSYFYRGVESMSTLADMHSLMDALPYSEQENMADVLKLTYKTEMEDVISRNSREPKLDLKSHMTFYRVPLCLTRCGIGKAEMEMLRYVQRIRSMEAQRQIEDFTYQPNPEYDLLKHVGVRHFSVQEPGQQRQLVACDILEKNNTPRLEAIKLLNHRFIFTEAQPKRDKRKQPAKQEKPSKKSKQVESGGTSTQRVDTPKPVMIRLSNGQYVERKKK